MNGAGSAVAIHGDPRPEISDPDIAINAIAMRTAPSAGANQRAAGQSPGGTMVDAMLTVAVTVDLTGDGMITGALQVTGALTIKAMIAGVLTIGAMTTSALTNDAMIIAGMTEGIAGNMIAGEATAMTGADIAAIGIAIDNTGNTGARDLMEAVIIVMVMAPSMPMDISAPDITSFTTIQASTRLGGLP